MRNLFIAVMLLSACGLARAGRTCQNLIVSADNIVNQRQSDGEDFYVKLTFDPKSCSRVTFESLKSPEGRYLLPQESVAKMEFWLPGESSWKPGVVLFANHYSPRASSAFVVSGTASKVAYVSFQTSNLIHKPCGTRFRLQLKDADGAIYYSSEFVLHDPSHMPVVEYTGDLRDAK